MSGLKLRYSEVFYSVQGEAKFTGVPSVFLRTFGCNFRCKSFGLPPGTLSKKVKHNPEVAEILDKQIHRTVKDFRELPLVHTGCDSYASVYPEFKKLMNDATVDELAGQMLELLPNGQWEQSSNGQDVHLVITGGEPLLGWQDFFVNLLQHPSLSTLRNLTFETNATQVLSESLLDFLNTQQQFETTFSCSPKLSASGEDWNKAIKPEVVAQYSTVNRSTQYLKFVVANSTDVDEVQKAVDQYRSAGVTCPVYLMPVGGRSEEYDFNVPGIVKLCMEQGWRFSPRLHISLFGNAWST